MNRLKTILTITMVMLLGFICTAALQPQAAFAKAAGNITTSCDAKNVKAGQTVRIKVSTNRMTVSTFIASVEYDGDMLEYKGYRGTDKKDNGSVYLSKQSDADIHTEVSVEKNKNSPIIGMYSAGTKEVDFAASAPLVTLIFEAKADGAVEYTTTETSAGKDGFTSAGYNADRSAEGQAAEGDAAGNSNASASDNNPAEDQNDNQNHHSGVLIGGTAAACAIAIAIIAIAVIKRRKR